MLVGARFGNRTRAIRRLFREPRHVPHKTDAYFVIRFFGLGPLPNDVLADAHSIMVSPDMERTRAAHRAGKELSVVVGRYTIAYVPAAPAWLSGMTLGPDGFILGPQAFATEGELLQTVLHELYWLKAGQAASGASLIAINRMTADARRFAAREWRLLCWTVRARRLDMT